MTKAELPTPALIVDLDMFEANVAAMAAQVAAAGKLLRPHAKAHKCPEVARRQIAAGAAGVCVATVPEAELMVRSGVRRVLLTSPLADDRKALRMADLAKDDDELTVVVDHPEQAAMYAEAASRARVTLAVLVDLDLGDHRTGIAPGDAALHLALDVASQKGLRLAGLQAYSVRASHTIGPDGRRQFTHTALEPAIATKHLLESKGLCTDVFSVGSTGSCEFDVLLKDVTEIQAGSYVFMDAAYAKIGGIGFGQALRVLATVVSANHDGFVTVDAGYKAFSTDRPFGPIPYTAPGATYEWGGDEFGYLKFGPGSRTFSLKDRVEFTPPHCDPTVNLHDRIYACRGDQVEGVWEIMNRSRHANAV